MKLYIRKNGHCVILASNASADQMQILKLDIPELVRPLHVLEKTWAYLEEWVLNVIDKV